jgi:hypothetical protein
MNAYTVISTYGDESLFLTRILASSLDEAVHRFMETRPSLLIVKVLDGEIASANEAANRQ